MKQVLVRGGKVSVEEVPAPACMPRCALVRVTHSLISSGTESAFVSEGGTSSYIMKKAKDPLNVEKVKRKLASIGIRGTIDLIRSKLTEFQTPGYSTAGIVVECGEGLQGFRVGDRVACAGMGYACHAEYNVVPQQLLTPIPDGVDMEEGAFVTLGAIAMQGCRQLFPTFGETFVVTGMGLLGQIAAQILRAAGCHVICSDPIESKRILATQLGADAACSPGELHAIVNEWTGGYGADGVLICAASKGSEVANQALELCRQKGRVSIVGAVGMDLARDAIYMKELDLRLSCSYGPGRYQPNYEEKGLDYPIGYVRWTEGRNMSEFLRMIADKKVQVKPLISLRKPVDEAQAAYGAVLDKDSGTIAALLLYGAEETAPRPPIERKIPVRPKLPKADAVNIAVIGAGAIANAFHLPSITRIPDARLVAVVDQVGSKAKQAATRFGAEYCTGDYKDVIADSNVDAVLIATRHNLHKPIAIAAAQAGKHVFVEKPMALTVPDCEEVREAVKKAGILLTVGFNRRFSKFSVEAKKTLRSFHGPKMILYRCNAGALPPGHWANDPEEGGGRIVGEAVHFFDLCCWLLDQDPVEIKANAVAGHTESTVAQDNLAASLRFPDGSLATVIYCTVGDSSAGKEYIEIHGSGKTIVIDNFQGIRFSGVAGKSAKQAAEHKGQYELLENWVLAIRGKAPLEITAQHGLRATSIALEVIRQCQRPAFQ